MSRPKQQERHEFWRQRIAQQESSGQSVRAFCRKHGLNEHSFYAWRKQLSGSSSARPVRFALVETTKPTIAPAMQLELILSGGERLQFPADAATLQMGLSGLQQKRP